MTGSLKGRKVALIGGGGFIGHNIALELHSRGAEVHIIDSLQVNNLGAFSNGSGDPSKQLYMQLIYERLAAMREINVPLHVLDARDYQVLSRCLSDIQPDTIVQLAAIAHANRARKLHAGAEPTRRKGRQRPLRGAHRLRHLPRHLRHRSLLA